MGHGPSSKRWRPLWFAIALSTAAMLLPALPAGAEPGVPPEILSIGESDQDIDPGETRNYRLVVSGYDEGGTFTFSGTGLTADVAVVRDERIRLTVTAAVTAEGGPRDLTVTNPDGLSDTFPAAITVTGTAPPPEMGDLAGHVFEDLDGDGVLDGGEPGISGVAVDVTDAGGTSVAAVTDGTGDFFVADLAVGFADVTVSGPAGHVLTTGNAQQAVTIVDGAVTDAEPVGYAAAPTGSVSGHVFIDFDGDGSENGADVGLPGASISVVDAVGATVVTSTDAGGDFVAGSLAVGDADLTVSASGGYTLTTGNDSQTLSITDGGIALAASVGYEPPVVGDSPNFVLVVTDDQRWDTVGRCLPFLDPYDFDAGADACMPNLQDLLMDSGTTFLKGEVTQSLCCPSRASILTGQYTTTHGVTTNTGADLDDSSTIATWLDDVGYRNGLFGKYLNGYGSGTLADYIPPGWDSFHALYNQGGGVGSYDDYDWIDWEAGGQMVISHFTDAESTSEDACAPGNYYSTDLACRRALDFLAADTTTPFFMFLTPVAPHSPLTPPGRHVGAFPGFVPAMHPDYGEIPTNPPSILPTEPLRANHFNLVTRLLRDAAITVLAVDDMIGALHDQLEADGRLSNTVWLFMSDNGYAAGEHRLSNKNCHYLVCHRVPYVVVCPPAVCPTAAPGAVDADNYVLNIDIAPTFAQLAGATPTIAVDGRSIVPILEDPSAPWRTEWFLHDGSPIVEGIVAVAADGHTYKYTELTDTDEVELYDLDEDPWELANLAGDPGHADIQADLAGRLADHLSP